MARRSTQGGFTYLLVLLLLAAFGLLLATAGTRWSTSEQRAKEAVLLRVGSDVRRAIGAYYESSPGSVKQFPPNLAALLLDARFVGVRRYLRKIPDDPMSRKPDWALISAPDGGVTGIHSQSDKTPLKTGNFSPPDVSFSSAAKYSDWQFVFAPPPTTPTSATGSGAVPPQQP